MEAGWDAQHPQHLGASASGASTWLQELIWEMNPIGAYHHPAVGAEGQQAPQSQGKRKPSPTTSPATK